MNVALWVAQALLALAFGTVGFIKLRDDRVTYANARPPMTSFVEDLSDRRYKTLGVLEVAGALGVVLPRLLGVAPVLTPLAALGIVGLMIGAMVLHLRRREPQLIVINVVLMLLALFVLWGRGVEVLLGNDAGA
jgi:DoxX-like family